MIFMNLTNSDGSKNLLPQPGMAMTGWHSMIYYYATRFLCSHVDVGTYQIVSENFISFIDLSPVMYSTIVICDIQKAVVAFYMEVISWVMEIQKCIHAKGEAVVDILKVSAAAVTIELDIPNNICGLWHFDAARKQFMAF